MTTVSVHLHPEDLAAGLRADVARGLTADPKWLPPKWFYDENGSRLFEQITQLDEYYPTRREAEILTREASEIVARSGADTVVELGSGTSDKTLALLDASAARNSLERFVAFDVSEAVLREASERIEARYPGCRVEAVVGDFDRHLHAIPTGGRRLVVFLGGTIGNLDHPQRSQFLLTLAELLDEGEHLLLGTDLVKDAGRLVRAYDDASGVTAAFNRNVLAVLNRELGADFDLERFAHEARWNAAEEHIEMWLRSEGEQEVSVPALELGVHFAAGEAMRTEISCKFRPEGVSEELSAAGFEVAEQWTDAADDFLVTLARRTGS